MGLLSRVESLVNTVGDDDNSIQSISAFSLGHEKRSSHALRTHLLEVVTGKIGPIVLLFGFYVMLYGHLSPGGGFQGGVIIASGIVFLALGNQQDHTSALSKSSILGGIESVSFLLFIFVAISGIFFDKGFFGNPLADSAYPVGFIVLMNSIIGLKVGASIGFMCIAMMGGQD
jgi:multicomponent Na+:H+ antiporter subunit B